MHQTSNASHGGATNSPMKSHDLDALRPTLTRIARIAKTMFRAAAADITVFNVDIWRASDVKGEINFDDPASELTARSGESTWIADLRRDNRFAAHPTVARKPHFRLYAGAPIILENGERIGTLAVYDTKSRDRDRYLAKQLND